MSTIAKRESDVITQADSDKQNGKVEVSNPKTIFKTNIWRSFPSYLSQNTLMLSDSRGVSIICVLFLASVLGISSSRRVFHPTSNSENLEMGTNGNEISFQRFPKYPEEKPEKLNPQSEPFKPNFNNFRTIIPGKKFPEIWITSRGCPWAL